MTAPASHDAYLAALPEAQRAALSDLRARIGALMPRAEECISYALPAWREGKVLLGYGAQKAHLALYTFSGALTGTLAAELAHLDHSRAAIRFTPDEPLPDALLARIVAVRRAEAGLP